LDASKNCLILASDRGTDVRAGFGSIFLGDFMSPLPLGGGCCIKLGQYAGRARRRAGNYRQGWHTDLNGGAGDAGGAHDKAHAVLLPGEHMLYLRADL